MQEGLKELEVLLDPYDWFYEVEAEARRYVVYVSYMCSEQDAIIPDRVQGKQVVVHFASSKTGSAKDYMKDPDAEERQLRHLIALEEKLGPIVPGGAVGGVAAKLRREKEDLVQRIEKLEKQVGPNILFDIFFEIHDGPNAVTNLGAKFPETHEGMKRLYDDYGFDPIYNELEG